MSALGVVYHLYDGTAVVHYQTCRWYRVAVHKLLPMRAKTKIRFCRSCRPGPEDVAADPPEVRWFEWGPYGGAPRPMDMDLEFAEKLAARRSLGIGKRNTTGRKWEG